jgi:hypothetical protein
MEIPSSTRHCSVGPWTAVRKGALASSGFEREKLRAFTVG